LVQSFLRYPIENAQREHGNYITIPARDRAFAIKEREPGGMPREEKN
jgi:hypothetical protein